jgi:histone acetyltransferase (RNA polymerase elongator complex component)
MNEPGRQKPFIIPVFIPHAGCPHQCLFCDQTRTTGVDRLFPTVDHLHGEIERFLGYRRDPDRRTEIAFFGGNFLGLSDTRITGLLNLAGSYVRSGRVQGIRFSTRPDTIDARRLALIRSHPVTTIEIGAQSMNAAVLAVSRRGHTPQETIRAMAHLEQYHGRIGLQMMVGLPGDSEPSVLDSARKMADLAPDFVRIYPCLVLKGSPLEQWHQTGRYTPLSLEESIAPVKQIYRLMTSKGIAVIRMGLQPTAELNAGAGVVAGPFHPAFGELVYSSLWLDALRDALETHGFTRLDLTIETHPSAISRVRGHRNANVDRLRREFKLGGIHTRPDSRLAENIVRINGIICPL